MARIEIFVPKYPAEPCAELTKELIQMFGGLTSTAGMGHWIDPDTGVTVSEDVFVLIAYISDDKLHELDINKPLRWYKHKAKQKLVMFALDNDAYYI